jgi:glutamyl-tRNA synthetase
LSKRLGSIGVEEIRGAGLEPLALLSLLARLGTSQPVEAIADLGELAADLDFAHFGRAPAHFDLHDVELLNARLLHRLEFADVVTRLPEGATEPDWLLLRGNLERLSDFAEWHAVIAGDIESPRLADDERASVAKAAEIAPTLDWSNEPWKALAEALKAATGLKGKALFHPLRLALTGHESGPEMAGLLNRMGRDRAVARLAAAANG